MRGRQIPLGGRVAARPSRPLPSGPDPLAAHGWREVAASGARRGTPRRRQPAPPRWRVRVALAALLLLVVASLAGWLATTPTLRVHQVRIQGTTDAALSAAVRALPLTGCFVLACDPDGAAARVAALPQVASAHAWLDPPATLVIRVTPRVPLLVWRTGTSALLVDAAGVVIGSASAEDTVRLPVVDDPSAAALPGGRTTPGTRLPASLAKLAAQLRSALPGLLGANVSLSYDAALGLVADDGSGLRVVFGDPSRPPADLPLGASGQVAELRAILSALAQAGQHASLIDLRWGTHPAYTLG